MNEVLKQKIKRILVLLIYICSIVIMSFIPDLGFIRYNYLTISLVSIIVILAAINNGWVYGTLCGLVFGICSFFVANDYDMNPIDDIFMNVFVAVIPRVFLGLSSAICYQWIIKIFKKRWISAMISSIISLASMVLIIYLLACVLEKNVLIGIYDETNLVYLFFQYVQYATLIETSIITIFVGLLTAVMEYLFNKNNYL